MLRKVYAEFLVELCPGTVARGALRYKDSYDEAAAAHDKAMKVRAQPDR